MVASDKMFTGSIPEIYDRLLVPLLFDPYARVLADRLASVHPQRVLETAAGTGALTRAMAARLDPSTRIVATDLNQPMLDRARAHSPLAEQVTWQQADALALPFPDQTFDAVACQFGAMFFPDKVKGYAEARRVLKPGGQFVFSVWDRIADNAFALCVNDAVARLFPDNPSTFMARVPHGYHDVDVIRRELSAAGFASVAVETVDQTSRGLTPRDVAVAYCQGTPLRNEIEARDAARLEDATRLATEALAQRFGASSIDGPIEGPMRAHVIAAG
jgi:ubiquinone/menaquinone biosynthesis C-methylase UbiE